MSRIVLCELGLFFGAKAMQAFSPWCLVHGACLLPAAGPVLVAPGFCAKSARSCLSRFRPTCSSAPWAAANISLTVFGAALGFEPAGKNATASSRRWRATTRGRSRSRSRPTTLRGSVSSPRSRTRHVYLCAARRRAWELLRHHRCRDAAGRCWRVPCQRSHPAPCRARFCAPRALRWHPAGP